MGPSQMKKLAKYVWWASYRPIQRWASVPIISKRISKGISQKTISASANRICRFFRLKFGDGFCAFAMGYDVSYGGRGFNLLHALFTLKFFLLSAVFIFEGTWFLRKLGVSLGFWRLWLC